MPDNRFENLKLAWTQPFDDYRPAVFDADLKAAGTMPRALYIGGGGNLAVVNAIGVEVVFTALQTGQIVPIRPIQMNTVNTTATAVLMLY